MSLFHNASLRRKLIWLTMICSVVALLTTAIALGTYEWIFYRRALVSHLETTSVITARNSAAALAFANQDDADRVLATLDAEPAIAAAALYDSAGKRFAAYRRPPFVAVVPEFAPADGLVRDGSELDLVVPVAAAQRFGTLLVHADLGAATERFVAYAAVLLVTTAVSGLLAFLLTGWLSNRIVAPVRALVRAAEGVQTAGDYTARVPKTEQDELGTLTDAFNDMLERVRQNEGALQRNAERLRLAIESAKIGTWDWNFVRDEIQWSGRTHEIFGVAAGTPINQEGLFSLVHPDDRARVRAAVEAAVDTSEDFAVEFRLARAERLPRHVAMRGLFLKSSAGDPLRAAGVVIDISERRAAEQRITESEARFRVVAERAPAMIWSCDHSLERDYFNRTWLTFTGRRLEEELGNGWQEGVPGADVFRWQEAVQAAAAQLDPYTVEYRLRRADGALRWVIETGSPRLAADGSFAGYLGSCIDITARKESEAELEAHVRERTRELQSANQELESFSYSVSHDLRGPVRAIQGFSEIALEEIRAGNAGAAVERLERVMRAAERMNKLIDAFISMARISRAELHIDAVNLSRLAEEIVAFLRSASPDRAIDITIQPGLECRGDERLLRIALENLIGNAWKFTARRPDARVEFGAGEKDGERVFFVRDNGAGFDAALAHKLFLPFERLHHASQFEGLGVGLSTVQRVIDKHNGRVWAEGEEGRGATFYFTVPGRPRTTTTAGARAA